MCTMVQVNMISQYSKHLLLISPLNFFFLPIYLVLQNVIMLLGQIT